MKSVPLRKTNATTPASIHRTTIGRAQEVNLDPQFYGTFAEIGAGQEVARFFFQAGKASQTIAKTISAYDMTFSDEIYGKEANGRYVCESRLRKMLAKEYSLLEKRLGKNRGPQTRFFAYANTVATGDSKQKFSHGWMGVRFQLTPGGPAQEIVLHVQLLDRHRLLQQETLGILGVNLVSCCAFHTESVEGFVDLLIENIKPGQISLDFIQVQGPNLEHFNNALLNLELVRKGLSNSILFGPQGSILNAGDVFFNRSLVIERGHFRPITNSHVDLMQKGLAQFQTGTRTGKANVEPLPVFEISMSSLDSTFAEQDFLDRVNTISALGFHVMVSKFVLFYQLKKHLRSYTKMPIAMIIGANLLDRLFEEGHYADLEGGLLEGLGKLMDSSTQVLVYPSKNSMTCSTLSSFRPAGEIGLVADYFRKKNWLAGMSNCDEIDGFINSNDILAMIHEKKSSWKKMVPAPVARLIESENFFRDRSPKAPKKT